MNNKKISISTLLICGSILLMNTQNIYADELSTSQSSTDFYSESDNATLETNSSKNESNNNIIVDRKTGINDSEMSDDTMQESTVQQLIEPESIITTVDNKDPYPHNTISAITQKSAYANITKFVLNSSPLADNPDYYSMVISINPGAAGTFTENKIYSIIMSYDDDSSKTSDTINNHGDDYTVTEGSNSNEYVVIFSKVTTLGQWLSDSDFETSGHTISIRLFFRGGIGTSGEGKLFYSDSTGIALPSREYLNDTNIPLQKDKAYKAIDAEAAKIKASIDADSTLSSEEKAKQKAKQKASVDTDAVNAKASIDAAATIDEINQAKNDGLAKIDGEHISGTPLEDQKKVAKSDEVVQSSGQYQGKSSSNNNTSAGLLPNTGEKHSVQIIITGILIALFSIFQFLKSRKRRQIKE